MTCGRRISDFHAVHLCHRVQKVWISQNLAAMGTKYPAEAGLSPTSVFIHGGDTVSRARPREYRVPKRDLVSRMQALLQSGRLKFAAGLPHLETLKEELSTFRAKISLDTGHASFEHWRARDHDDLVLALAISLWRAERWTPAPELPPSLSC